jgi:hypothetical protein
MEDVDGAEAWLHDRGGVQGDPDAGRVAPVEVGPVIALGNDSDDGEWLILDEDAGAEGARTGDLLGEHCHAGAGDGIVVVAESAARGGRHFDYRKIIAGDGFHWQVLSPFAESYVHRHSDEGATSDRDAPETKRKKRRNEPNRVVPDRCAKGRRRIRVTPVFSGKTTVISHLPPS